MRQQLAYLGLVLLTMSALPAVGQSPGGKLPAPELKRPCDLATPMIRIATLLDRLEKDTGVALEADKGLAELTVFMYSRGRTTRSVLEQLATVVDGTWSTTRRNGKDAGYRLVQSQAARDRLRDGRLRHAQQRGVELDRELKLIGEYAEKLKDLPVREAHQATEDLRIKAEALPVGAERYAAECEHKAAVSARDPAVRACVSAIRLLPPAAYHRLLLGERVVVAARRPGAIPMTPAVVAEFRAARQFIADREARGPQRPVAKQTDDEAVNFVTRLSNNSLLLFARTRRLWDTRGVPELLLPRILATPSWQAFGQNPYGGAPGKVTAELRTDLERPVRFDWQPRKLDPEQPATYSRGILAGEVVHALRETPPFAFCGESNFKWLRSVRRPGEAATSGYEGVEAAFGRLSTSGGVVARPTLGQLLGELAERGDLDAHVTRDGWVRLRSTVTFLDRPGAVDPDAIRRLFRESVTTQSFTRATALAAAGELTHAQFTTLFSESLGFLRSAISSDQVRGGYDVWRLIGELSPQQRDALLAGQRLSYANLSRADQAAFGEFVTGISEHVPNAPLDLDLGADELPRVSFGLTGAPDSPIRLFDVRLEGVPDPLFRMNLVTRPAPVMKPPN